MRHLLQRPSSLILEAHVGKQGHVNGTWRNEDIGIENAVLTGSCQINLSELGLDLESGRPQGMIQTRQEQDIRVREGVGQAGI